VEEFFPRLTKFSIQSDRDAFKQSLFQTLLDALPASFFESFFAPFFAPFFATLCQGQPLNAGYVRHTFFLFIFINGHRKPSSNSGGSTMIQSISLNTCRTTSLDQFRS
jgi:hypothetical protein